MRFYFAKNINFLTKNILKIQTKQKKMFFTGFRSIWLVLWLFGLLGWMNWTPDQFFPNFCHSVNLSKQIKSNSHNVELLITKFIKFPQTCLKYYKRLSTSLLIKMPICPCKWHVFYWFNEEIRIILLHSGRYVHMNGE